MTPVTPPPPDSGTPPDPHYCTSADGAGHGCANWPGCLLPYPPRNGEQDGSTLGQDMIALSGWAAGGVLIMVIAAILLPLFI
jgi:hypothetical protein